MPGALVLVVVVQFICMAVCLATGRGFSFFWFRAYPQDAKIINELKDKVGVLNRMLKRRNICITFLGSSMRDLSLLLRSRDAGASKDLARLYYQPFYRLPEVLYRDDAQNSYRVALYAKCEDDPDQLAVVWRHGFDSQSIESMRLPIGESTAGYAYKLGPGGLVYVSDVLKPPRRIPFYRHPDQDASYRSAYRSLFCICIHYHKEVAVLSVDAVEVKGLNQDDQEAIVVFAHLIQLTSEVGDILTPGKKESQTA